MKSRIKLIQLQDGKQIFFPSDDEMLRLSRDIESFIIEEIMTRSEFEAWSLVQAMSGDKGWLKPEDWIQKHKQKLWYCPKCDKDHELTYVCEILESPNPDLYSYMCYKCNKRHNLNFKCNAT